MKFLSSVAGKIESIEFLGWIEVWRDSGKMVEKFGRFAGRFFVASCKEVSQAAAAGGAAE